MKKIIGVLLAVCIAMTMTGSLAAVPTDYTIEEKLEGQVTSSGLRGSVSLTVSGDKAPFSLDEETWALIGMIAGSIGIDFESTVRLPAFPDRSAAVSIKKDGTETGVVKALIDGGTFAFHSDLINDKAWYSLPADTDLFSVLFPAAPGEWPSPWRMLHAVCTAPEDWVTRAAQTSASYMTKLAIWLQNYQVIGTETENRDSAISMKCEIPVRDAVAEMKQLLTDIYNDPAMLALFRELFTAEESAAYLEPGMSGIIFNALDQLKAEGTILIEREYDYQGVILKDAVSFPFAEGFFLNGISIDLGTDEKRLSGSYRADDALYPFEITASGPDDGLYSGTIRIEYPAPEKGSAAEDDTKPEGIFSASFSLTADDGEETYDRQNDLCERKRSYTVILRPNDDNSREMDSLTASLSLDVSSQSRMTAPTTVTGSLSLMDQDTESGITLDMSMKTVAKWQPDSLSTLTDPPIALNTLKEPALQQIFASWQAQALAWLAKVILPVSGN